MNAAGTGELQFTYCTSFHPIILSSTLPSAVYSNTASASLSFLVANTARAPPYANPAGDPQPPPSFPTGLSSSVTSSAQTSLHGGLS